MYVYYQVNEYYGDWKVKKIFNIHELLYYKDCLKVYNSKDLILKTYKRI